MPQEIMNGLAMPACVLEVYGTQQVLIQQLMQQNVRK